MSRFLPSISLCCYLSFTYSYGQINVTDSSDLDISVKNAVAIYKREIGINSRLYNGPEYTDFDFRIAGHAFFESEDIEEEGTVFYDGILYENIPLHYDIVKDELVTEHYGGSFKIKLFNDKVKYFKIFGHTFIRIDNESISVPVGFYDKVYDGTSSVLVRRGKLYEETISDREVHREFIPFQKFYIQKDGNYYEVKGKSSVLKVFQDHKRAIVRLLRKNAINFRKNPEFAIIKMTEFYDSLNSQQ